MPMMQTKEQIKALKAQKAKAAAEAEAAARESAEQRRKHDVRTAWYSKIISQTTLITRAIVSML